MSSLVKISIATLLLLIIQSRISVICVSAASRAEIVTPPMNVNVSVNGETYMNCTIIGDYISWKANNTPVNFFSHLGLFESLISTLLDKASNKRIGQLRIRGSPELNGTKITCIATQIGTEFSNSKSDTVMILVQGIPDPVTDLKIITSSSTMANSAIISWKPPHTLDGIKLTYHVEVATCSIMNVADFDGTSLNHTLPHHNVSHAVNVKAVIDAGAGAATTHTIRLPNFEVELITGTQAYRSTVSSTAVVSATTTLTPMLATTQSITNTCHEYEIYKTTTIVLAVICFVQLLIIAIIICSCICFCCIYIRKGMYTIGI